MKKIRLLVVLIGLFLVSKFSFATNGDTLIVSPNPFDSITVIHFEITSTDTVYLDVFNSTGSSIKTYFNATVLTTGLYSFNFNGDTLPNGIYFVKLKINSTKIFNVKLIKVSKIVGVKEYYKFNNVLLYPNPTNSIINIYDENNQFGNSNIEIKNYLGQKVLEIPFTNMLDLSGLDSGIYFLILRGKVYNTMNKIIKE